MSRGVMQQALDALEGAGAYMALLDDFTQAAIDESVKALREALAQPEHKPMTTEQFTEIAHRTASNYTHRGDPAFTAYTFLPYTLADFVRKIEQAHGIEAKP